MGLLTGKVAIVTGSTRGIGEATAKLLAKEGAISIITGRTEDAGEKVAQEIISSGGKAEYHNLDITDEQNVKKVIDAVYNKYGRLDILVNNAGITGPNKPTHEYSKEEWENVFRVNVTGPFLCTKYVVPYMQKENGGNIVYISSIYGIVGAPDVPAYHATKAAIRIMAKIDALLYTKDNIRVNSIHPGYIWTSMVQNFIRDQSKKTGLGIEEIKKNMDSMQPIGHIGEPIDIAYGVLYLVSSEAKFVTGSELVIDGGYTAT
ncbi:MAG: glucose 1-dehydrogenase [Methanothrix sp.]|nr:glucose 1-dehydrogenase [Methanothrix sp.]